MEAVLPAIGFAFLSIQLQDLQSPAQWCSQAGEMTFLNCS